MSNNPNETSSQENLVIESNIIKGAKHEYSDCFQAGKILFDVLKSDPDHVLQIEAETEKKTTFAEMKDRSVCCALWQKKQGIGRGDVVTYRSDDVENASYIPILASFFLGATYNALNRQLSSEQTQELMRILQPKVIFIFGNTTEMVVQAAKMKNNNVTIITFDKYPGLQSLDSILQNQNENEVQNFQPEIITESDYVAYIIQSSGTTGLLPKPIIHSYANLVKHITACQFLTRNIVLWYSPSYSLQSFIHLMRIIYSYQTRIIHKKFDPEETSKLIEKYMIGIIVVTSPQMDQLCQSNVLKKYQLKSLKLAIIVGAKVNPRTLAEFHRSLPLTVILQSIDFIGVVAEGEGAQIVAFSSIGFGSEMIKKNLHNWSNIGVNEPRCAMLRAFTSMYKILRALSSLQSISLFLIVTLFGIATMSNRPNETSLEENFVIENNIIKGAEHEYPDCFQAGKILFNILNNDPDHVPQIEAETGKKTTFAEMKDRSVRCALWLKKQGIGRGDVIASRSDDMEYAYIPILASIFLGATYNGLNRQLASEQTQELMRILQPKVIFISGNTTKIVAQGAQMKNNNVKIITFDNYPGFQSLDSVLQNQNDDEVKDFQPEIITDSEDIAYIVQSSDATGVPKPIIHSYASLVKHITSYPLPMKCSVLLYSPSYSMSGFINLLRNIYTYQMRIIHKKFDPEETCKVIEKYMVELIIITSPQMDQLCQSNVLKKYQLTSVELVMTIGGKVNPRTLEEFHKSLPLTKILQSIGYTETGIGFMSQMENSRNIHSVGSPLPGVEIKIRDLQTNEALGPNKSGELCVKTCMIMKGYLQNEEATKKALDKEGWYHTGDVAYYNEDGEFFIIDRMADIINYKNQQIWPSEIEDILLRREDVLEAAVLPIPHDDDGEQPIAFVKKTPGSNVTEEELMKLSETLGEYKKLHGGVKFVDELPRTPGGKIILRKLIEMVQALA